ncbi:type II toxin-antitoxin system Phd/YefM family antitoxin [Terrabacter sp. Soil811]|uniref:type II toxin-antitoxin system Phd/YefM family antitoxin n=1 Tax=Terrabacter sp. Soil811 TaxID=1736419 RepID=UPI0009E72293|nr:type II toxin-antitoxin system prevent-host-death family antitoxin [Terrabacter sp. Soil811]
MTHEVVTMGGQQVGIRELKSRLSEYVDRARAGETLVITDRGRPVAELRPLSGRRALETLLDEGLATRAHPKRPSPEPLDVDGPISDLVGDQSR